MKYLNQANVVLMLVGCVVVVYSFSVTFWKQKSVVPRSLDLPQVETSSGGVNATGSPLFRRTTTAASAAVERSLPGRTRRTVSRGTEATPAPGSISGLSRAYLKPAEEEPEDPAVTQVGERRQAVSAGRQADEDTLSPAEQRSWRGSPPESDPIAPRVQPARPDGAAEAQKRDESRNPSTPPVRTSLMGRQPQ